MFRLLKSIAMAVAISAFALAAWDVATYDAKAWRADYEYLKRELAQRYANLDWIVSYRRLDLRALDAETGSAIDNAHSRVFAALALRRFANAFADPHLKLAFPEGTRENVSSASTAAPRPIMGSCESAGYKDGNHAFEVPFDRLPGWKPLRGGSFPAGIAGDLGVLRISAFGEFQYLSTCKTVFRNGLAKRELQLVVRAKLNEELAQAIAQLKAQGARRLLVDVSGNGGGSEWVDDVVVMLTDRELVRQTARVARPSCDRSGIWRGESVCPVLAPAGEPLRLVGTGQWTGPLFALMDRNTGSASEDFIVWLKENGVATALGARTAGAGCGYVGGDGRIRMSVAPFDVIAPNCARFLKDGTNEIEGIAPDVELPIDDVDASVAVMIAALRL
jgi:hypothetical protein